MNTADFIQTFQKDVDMRDCVILLYRVYLRAIHTQFSSMCVCVCCVQARSLQGFWSELQWNTERTKYLDAVPNPRYRTSHIQADWEKLVSVCVYVFVCLCLCQQKNLSCI